MLRGYCICIDCKIIIITKMCYKVVNFFKHFWKCLSIYIKLQKEFQF